MATFAKSNIPRFALEVRQNRYLPDGGRDVHAVVSLTSTGGGTSGGAPLTVTGPGDPTAGGSAAVVLMVDCSRSMDYPPAKLRNARAATAAALDTLRDGDSFAVVAGTHRAAEVFPGGGGLAVAGPATRAAAKRALEGLTARGGTAIGGWLRLADRLLRTADAPVRHGILLTDGRNEHEEPAALRAALADCAGRFTCDARGVGTDWEVAEVTEIASALLGTADIVADPDRLTADFTALMSAAVGKGVADVALRLWLPEGAHVVFVRQVAPTVRDLTGRAVASGPRTLDYPTGSWGDESRDVHLCVRVPAAAPGSEMLAARVSLERPAPGGGETLAQGLVRAVWTDDVTVSTALDPAVAHYTGQAELARAIQRGLDMRKSGDEVGAVAELGRAVALAHSSGNADTAALLSKVVDVVDAVAGTVRLRTQVAEADEMTLETRSTKTVRVTRK
ncbi:VWA domain-containing protein [Streptomyces sp. AJS327]|uniref:VWA domain-containing protein n=1 Tax=Streptomyces sp. AJS327 TaxID=2545265 RepID=UPI0015DFF5B9|nr:VWA domain-containing protein [Streptomyces sp. AJS327]MBA0049802.1 VWA domain-containing protein [Streptomyces sp. AJS327]